MTPYRAYQAETTQTDEVDSPKSAPQPQQQVDHSHALPLSAHEMAHKLHTAPPQIRRQIITSLQRQHGNRFVQRLVEDYQTGVIQRDCSDCAQHEEDEEQVRRTADIQRYTVPGHLTCMETVSHMNQSSPYRPNWAKTTPRYTFNGTTQDSHEQLEGGGYSYTMQGRSSNTVTHTVSQDLPQWNPTERPNREAEVAAWNAMHGTLQQHENRHSEIAETNRAAMESDWQGVNIEGNGDSLAQAQADAASQLASDKQLWLDQSDAEQARIDPFSVTLTCPAPPVEDEEGEGEEGQSTESAAAPISITGQAHGEHATG